MTSSAVGVFMKWPEVGAVKTRLGESIGMRNAAEFYAVCLGWFLRRLEAAELPFVIFYDPPDKAEDIRRFYRLDDDRTLVAQEGDDLGEKMYHALEWMDAEVDGPSVIVGSDSPDLPTEWIREGLDALTRCPMVLGPCQDGGYYLVGSDEPRYALFDGVDWSTSDVLKQTLSRARDCGFSPYMLPRWRDIDTVEDLMARC
jgi:rSAM/selenodomain-associated transferase 1